MDRYIGLDGYPSSCTVAVIGHGGMRLQTRVIETDARVLIDILELPPRTANAIMAVVVAIKRHFITVFLSAYCSSISRDIPAASHHYASSDCVVDVLSGVVYTAIKAVYHKNEEVV